jgi:hypothetical protein
MIGDVLLRVRFTVPHRFRYPSLLRRELPLPPSHSPSRAGDRKTRKSSLANQLSLKRLCCKIQACTGASETLPTPDFQTGWKFSLSPMTATTSASARAPMPNARSTMRASPRIHRRRERSSLLWRRVGESPFRVRSATAQLHRRSRPARLSPQPRLAYAGEDGRRSPNHRVPWRQRHGWKPQRPHCGDLRSHRRCSPGSRS